MTPKEIADKADFLRKEQLLVVEPGYSNYRKVIAEYKQIINDALVLIRELAQHLERADGS